MMMACGSGAKREPGAGVLQRTVGAGAPTPPASTVLAASTGRRWRAGHAAVLVLPAR